MEHNVPQIYLGFLIFIFKNKSSIMKNSKKIVTALEEFKENLNISDVRIEFNFDDIVDILQTIKALYNIENDIHPQILKGSNKHEEFKKWYEDKYIKSGKLDNIIKKIN